MQLKRWIVNSRKISRFAQRDKLKLFFIYFRLCFLHDRNKEHLFHPLMLNLQWNKKNFEFFVREKLDLDALLHIFVDEEYALEKIPEPKTIIDCGSNIGVTVIQFKLFWPNSKVIAIEPDPSNIVALSQNIKQFGDSVIMVDKAASSSNDEKLNFYISQKGHMSSSIVQRRDDDEKCVVETITLDKIIDLNNIKHVDLLKFDVEGSEYQLFQGLKNKKIVSYIAGELHKDLIPEGFEEFLDQLTLDFDIVDGHHLINNSSVRKPVILAKNKN